MALFSPLKQTLTGNFPHFLPIKLAMKIRALFMLCPLIFALACSNVADTPYIVSTGGEVDASENLARCQSQEFLTADCVEVLAGEAEQEQEDQALVLAASLNVNDLSGCFGYEAMDANSAATSGTDCSEVVETLLAGFDVCVARAEAEKYYECLSIEDSVNETVELCDASSPDVTTDFCALINPTTDTP